jgi:transcriptional regulator with XRE-family HTH domain
MTFGDILQQLRLRKEMTQQELSAKSGLSLGIIRDYEQGRKEPGLLSAFKLSRALEVSTEVFREGWPTLDSKKKPTGKPKAKPAASKTTKSRVAPIPKGKEVAKPKKVTKPKGK